MEIDLSLDRLARYMSKAQRVLDQQVLTDMVPYIPMRDGMLTEMTQMINQENIGTGELILDATEYARFLYHGKVMVYPPTHSPWAPAGEMKVVDPNWDIDYSTAAHPNAGPEWFDRAKDANKRKWLKMVRQEAGRR